MNQPRAGPTFQKATKNKLKTTTLTLLLLVMFSVIRFIYPSYMLIIRYLAVLLLKFFEDIMRT